MKVKRVVTIILALFLIALLGISAYIVIRVRRNQAPETSSACEWWSSPCHGGACRDYWENGRMDLFNDTSCQGGGGGGGEGGGATKCGGYANPGEIHCRTTDCTEHRCNSDGSWTQVSGTQCEDGFAFCRSGGGNPVCGDGACNGAENCSSCLQDCSGGAGCGGGGGGGTCTPEVRSCSDCSPGMGRLCQSNGTFGACVRMDGCGATGNEGEGSPCNYNSECASGNCSSPDGSAQAGVCVGDSTGECTGRWEGYSPGSFVGCGDVAGCGTRCDNCFLDVNCNPVKQVTNNSCEMMEYCQAQATYTCYSCNSANQCVSNTQSTSCTTNCDNCQQVQQKTCWQTGCTGVGCSDGTTCQNDRCVNPSCPSDSDCNCTQENPTLYFCTNSTTCNATTAFATVAACEAAHPGLNCYGTNANCVNNAPTECPVQQNTYYFCTTSTQCSSGSYATVAACETAHPGLNCYGTSANCLTNAPTECPAAPYCGDAICNDSGELCEETSNGSNTYRACTSADYTARRAPTGTVVSDCRGAANNQTVTANTCKYCGDGVRQSPPEQCDYAVDASCNNDCTWQAVQNQCLDVVENGTDPVAGGVGNLVVYTLVYQHNSTTDPYPNIRLRVWDSANTLGRDANATTNALVAPDSVTRNTGNSTWTYRFVWEAADPAGTAVADGTYDVQVMLDGTDVTLITSPASCLEQITVESTTPENPLFVINKQSAPVCESNGDATITYTITVTNIGPVGGVIDWVEDNFDQNLITLGITPTNITPTYGQIVTGTNVIRWEGSVLDRTFASGESKAYSYRVRIPYAQLINFAFTGVYNQAEVQYDTNTTTDNTASYDLRTMLTCSLPVVPITGIFDNQGRFFLLGLLLVIIGLIIYQFKIGSDFTERLMLKGMASLSGFFPQKAFERRIQEKIKKKADED